MNTINNSDINEKIQIIENKIEILNNKLDQIILLLNGDLKKNCEKMGEHINFIENVYDNVKSPLGFLCNKINSISNSNNQYSLEYNEKDFHDEELRENEKKYLM